MYPSDEEKMAFIIKGENYCYKVIPFGMKNNDVAYQKLMDKIFRNLISKIMEVYMDDMVKSIDLQSHIGNLREVFSQLYKYNMRLNLEKCAFDVRGGKFLGFMLTNWGLEANPNKYRAIL